MRQGMLFTSTCELRSLKLGAIVAGGVVFLRFCCREVVLVKYPDRPRELIRDITHGIGSEGTAFWHYTTSSM